jgi:hypothetical protein
MSTPGKMKLFPARGSLVSGIPAGDGKTANLFLQCTTWKDRKDGEDDDLRKGLLEDDYRTTRRGDKERTNNRGKEGQETRLVENRTGQRL